MTRRRTLYSMTGAAALVLISAAACADRQAEPLSVDRTDATLHGARHGASGAANTVEVSRWLANLRQATAAFHDTETASSAGWNAQITDCMDMPGTGAMGYHIANGTLIDGVAQDLAPELLVYEPQQNGRRRLVAVEYIIPFGMWPDDAPPPSLHGVDFHRNEGFGLWVLHAWVWKHNPAGMFEDWNPAASCEFAQ